jgi:hypothetical protein
MVGPKKQDFCPKINEFERKKSEKNEKISKTQKLQAFTLRYNSHSISNISHGKSTFTTPTIEDHK